MVFLHGIFRIQRETMGQGTEWHYKTSEWGECLTQWWRYDLWCLNPVSKCQVWVPVLLPTQLAANMHPVKQQMMAQGLGFPSPCKKQIILQAFGFNLLLKCAPSYAVFITESLAKRRKLWPLRGKMDMVMQWEGQTRNQEGLSTGTFGFCWNIWTVPWALDL